GEAGMGKSRLLAHVAALAAGRQPGTRILFGRGQQGGFAYAPFADILAQRFAIVPGLPADDWHERIMTGVSEVLSADRVTEVVHLLAHLMRVPIPDSPVVGPLALHPQQLQTRTFIALRRLLAADAGRAPLLIVVDDLDRCGPETSNLLLYLAAGLRAAPVVLLAAARPVVDERHPRLSQVEPAPQRVELGPLDRDESLALVRQLCAPVGDVPAQLEAHAAVLGGSPRLIGEFVRLLVESGVIRPDGDQRWTVDDARLAVFRPPGNYSDVVAQRLALMSSSERQLLARAAVVGRTFWLDAVVALSRARLLDGSHPDGPDLSEITRAGAHSRAAVADTLSWLARSEWLVPVAEPSVPGEREYRFTHPELWTAVLTGVAVEDRRRYHRTAAQWLELRPDGRGPLAQEAIAYHLERAGLHGGAAIRYRRAGDAARATYFNRRAIHLYIRALDCANTGDVVTRMEIWHDLGSVYQLIGEFDAAIDAFERMLRLSWVVAARSKAAVAFNKMGRVWRSKGDLRLALEYLERGAELFERTGDERGAAGSLDDIGKVLFWLGRYDEAYDKVRAGLERRGNAGDPRSIAASLSNLGNIEKARGRIADGRRCHQQALELVEDAGDRWGVVSARNNIAVLDCQCGDTAAARSGWQTALTEAEAIGALPMQALVLCNLGELAVDEGQLGDARRRLEEALSVAQDIDERRLQVEAMRNLARLEHRLGDSERARELALRS
ncbi:MAG: tetratricopeptide repeat protein, partial [Myxococcota bacterium]